MGLICVLMYLVISPHCIAMPKGLYFTAVVSHFFLLLFRCLSLRSLNGSQPNLDTYLLMTVIWKIWCELPWAFTLVAGGKKTLFWGRTLNFHRTYFCNRTWYQQSERNLSIYRDSPTSPQIAWTLVQKWLRTVGKFSHPPKFLHWATMPALPYGRYIRDSRQTLAHVI